MSNVVIEQLIFLRDDQVLLLSVNRIVLEKPKTVIKIDSKEYGKLQRVVPKVDEFGEPVLDEDGDQLIDYIDIEEDLVFSFKLCLYLYDHVLENYHYSEEGLKESNLLFKGITICAYHTNCNHRIRYTPDMLKPVTITQPKTSPVVNKPKNNHLDDLRFGKGKRW